MLRFQSANVGKCEHDKVIKSERSKSFSVIFLVDILLKTHQLSSVSFA
jgi:hypothetical protein